MSALQRLIAAPRLVEVDHVDLTAPPKIVWERLRHGDLASSPIVHLLFAIRGLPSRLAGEPPGPPSLRIDDLVSTPERPGFRVLIDEPPREVAVGAIGKVWEPEIPFVHMPSPEAYAAFHEPDYVRVAWAVRVLPRGEAGSRVEIEVRVDATDDAAWHKFKRYFLVIGIGSRLIRKIALRALARELGDADQRENDLPLAGDERIDDAVHQVTHWIDIDATPAAIWPWLVQMGCGRAGFYSLDALDNGGVPSARVIHPEWQGLAVGDVIRATPAGEDGFEVLQIDRGHHLVLGSLFDGDRRRQIPFASPRPEHFMQMTWAFVLEPLTERSTRLHVRVRAVLSRDQAPHLAWAWPAHEIMERVQLRQIAERAEGHPRHDAWEDALAGAAYLASLVRRARRFRTRG